METAKKFPNTIGGYLFDFAVRLDTGMSGHVIPDLSSLVCKVAWPLLPDLDVKVLLVESEDRVVETFVTTFQDKKLTLIFTEHNSENQIVRVRESSSRVIKRAHLLGNTELLGPAKVGIVFRKD